MKVGIIWAWNLPPDVRAIKQINTLIQCGHEVHLICANTRGDQASILLQESVEVHRLKYVSFLGSLNRVWQMKLFANPIWLHKIHSVVRSNQIDVLQVREFYLVLPAIVCGRACRTPVIFDMAENYPAYLRWRKETFLDRFSKPIWLVRILERLSARWADCVIVVVEEQKERLERLGVDEGKIVIVENTVDLDLLASGSDDCGGATACPNDSFVISYVGNFGPHRGLDTAIRAMARILSAIPTARLVLVGDGVNAMELARLTQSMGLQEHVCFTGRVEYNQVRRHILMSDVCLIPHIRSEHIDTTIPNKLFEYMALGKPVVVSDARPLARIVRACDCGLVFKSGDWGNLARAIVELRDRDKRRTLGENGRRAVQTQYNWSITSKRYLRALSALTRLESGQHPNRKLEGAEPPG